MEALSEPSADEVTRLRLCLNDLVGLMAVPTLWTGADPVRIVNTLLDALLGVVDAIFVVARIKGPDGRGTIEATRVSAAWRAMHPGDALREALDASASDAASAAMDGEVRVDGTVMRTLRVPLGFQGALGALVVGSDRPDFPNVTERLLVDVAANQATLAVQQAQLLERATEERLRTESALHDAEREALLIVDTIPGLVALLTPTGAVDVANAQLIEYFGQTLAELKDWGTNGTVHPNDLAHVAEIFTRSVASGTPYDIMQRLRRADGSYRWMQNRGFPLRARTGEIARWCVLLTDIDDQKRAEEALRESEREARLIVDTIPGLVVLLTPSGEIEFVNNRTVEYLGLELPAANEWAFNGIVNPEDLPRVLPIFQRGVTLGVSFEYEVRLRHVDGTYRWFQLRAHPLRSSTGDIGRWYLLLSDIDGLKRAEAAQQASERELRLIVDTIPGLVVILSATGAVDFENGRTKEYVGPALATTGEWATNGIVHPDDAPRVVPIFVRGVSTGEPFEYEVRLRHVSGVYGWFLLRAHPLRDSNGKVARWYVLLSDIDDRRRTEEELRRSEVFLSEGQRISQTGTFSWNVQTDAITFSEELYRIFEFDLATTITFDRIIERVAASDQQLLAERMAEVRAGRDNPEYDIRLQVPVGGTKHVHVLGRVVRDAQGHMECIGAIQDVTRRRVAEEARDAARTELAHVTRVMSLNSLTASIAHEINQPLSGIITNASTCLRMLGAEQPDVEGARETARRTIRDGNRASDIVTRLRGLFSNRQFAPVTLDINDAVSEVIELSLADLQRNHVSLQTDLEEGMPVVIGDRVQLQQVLLNLLRNASDAMADIDDRTRHVLIRTRRDDEGAVYVTVRDSGQGLDPQEMHKLFDPFYTTKEGGMGIGLSLSRTIIQQHRGRIWAEAHEGPGASFSFSIPAHVESAAASAGAAQRAS